MKIAIALALSAALLGAQGCANLNGGGVTDLRQSTAVRPGMDMNTVTATIGNPMNKVQFRNEPGPTWTYALPGNGYFNSDFHVFDVDFGPDGKVRATSFRVIHRSEPGSLR